MKTYQEYAMRKMNKGEVPLTQESWAKKSRTAIKNQTAKPKANYSAYVAKKQISNMNAQKKGKPMKPILSESEYIIKMRNSGLGGGYIGPAGVRGGAMRKLKTKGY